MNRFSRLRTGLQVKSGEIDNIATTGPNAIGSCGLYFGRKHEGAMARWRMEACLENWKCIKVKEK
jgi:hypothetical protein